MLKLLTAVKIPIFLICLGLFLNGQANSATMLKEIRADLLINGINAKKNELILGEGRGFISKDANRDSKYMEDLVEDQDLPEELIVAMQYL